MKGQYLAVETVFTFGLGLLVAIGIITLFDQYRIGAMESAEPDQVDVINSEILYAMETLKHVDEDGRSGSGRIDLDLPDDLAGKSYSLRLNNNLTVLVGSEQYEVPVRGFTGYDLSGGAPGGDVTVFKENKEFILGAN